jgi:predicted ATPase/class 3 adenylate cyclase
MRSVQRDLPSGTVTFLFTDVEGSTKLLHELGAAAYAEVLAEHRRIVRKAFSAQGGVEVDTQGDAFFVAFPTAPGALAAAQAMTEALASGRVRLRVGLHTGMPLVTEEGYVGGDVHRAARIAACGHGGQVLVSSSTASLVELGLRDLGEHRLKDLSAPERIYQLGKNEFPPLKTLYRTNLPIPATAFLGRERELAEVASLLAREDVRLLTLTGPGGTGKTRLALQAAGEASERYPDGVYWVPLAPLRDSALVLEEAAQALGAQDGLAEHIKDKQVLLLFDNFEQVVEAAFGLASLLAACPNLCVLVTSREPLHLSGEQEYSVPPLMHEEGVGFFMARARAVKPDFEPGEAVPEICRRLDELPLALELAAARVKALSSRQILERLEQRLPLLTGGARDLPERQRTLRATIEWSYELLAEEEQQLFARLAVFRGGCTLEAAEEVGDADLDTLQSLVDKSLLRFSNERYWMLETVHEYAAEHLNASSGEAGELRRRHAEHFLALAEVAQPHLREIALRGRAVPTAAWLDRLELEHDNIRASLDHLESAGATYDAMRIAGALWVFWYENAHFDEGLRRLRRLLSVEYEPTAARAKALGAAVDLALMKRDLTYAETAAQEELAIYRQVGGPAEIADALWSVGSVCFSRGEFEAACSILEESITLHNEAGELDAALGVMRTLAASREGLEEWEQAWALRREILRRARELGNTHWEMTLLGGMAVHAVQRGRPAEALALVREHLPLACGQGRIELAVALCRCAYVLTHAGNADASSRILARAEVLIEELGGISSWVKEMNEDTHTLLRARLDEAAFAAAREEGRKLTADEAGELALAATEPEA